MLLVQRSMNSIAGLRIATWTMESSTVVRQVKPCKAEQVGPCCEQSSHCSAPAKARDEAFRDSSSEGQRARRDSHDGGQLYDTLWCSSTKPRSHEATKPRTSLHDPTG